MNMNEQLWNDAVAPYVGVTGGFLQSYAWGEFQKSQGREVCRIFEKNSHGVVLAQAIKLRAPLSIQSWFIPKGPLGNASGVIMREVLLRQLPSTVDYIRTESAQRLPETVAVHDIHPRTTRVLDLAKGHERLMAEYSMRARYNARLAKKKGVEAYFVELDRYADFATLMSTTAARDAFHLHEQSYYRSLLEVLGNARECQAKLALAVYRGIPLAAALTIDAFGTRTYLHGASGNEFRELKAPHMLQDFVIKDACQEGLSFYDFWGVAPAGATEKHPWYGITKFKESFGGHVCTSAGTYDIPVRRGKYQLYRAAKFIQSLRGK